MFLDRAWTGIGYLDVSDHVLFSVVTIICHPRWSDDGVWIRLVIRRLP